ncbi:3'-5' exonuclease [Helicobacter turcicus]|uniref:3'-5' exonuclease n=1 Tax=Helicobacter turcicus TaxID=2867412 RepID=A0ABS7JLI8_9HELI|nr:3'-5' exonuclease [Helicobacter turcicus]MBX7490254.1 3'-5' exonuclease [Helicobacter turcicus]MBX7545167.1 3'-5' exonuclease [Helicobacter turcicus]
MPKRYDKILAILNKRPLSENELLSLLTPVAGLFGDIESELEIFKNSGIPIEIAHNNIYFRPKITPIIKETFCIVDIETNGHNPYIHAPIEIGALKVRGGEIIDSFESFVYNIEIPEYITKITGINAQMLENAPRLTNVLEKFKLFLGDSIFVAHNVDFDYNFLSQSLERCGFGYLYNPRLCTLKLAQSTLESPRYSLGFLNEFLGINHQDLHRALRDSKTAWEVFKIALKKIPQNLYTSKDLLEFVKNTPKVKYAKAKNAESIYTESKKEESQKGNTF